MPRVTELIAKARPAFVCVSLARWKAEIGSTSGRSIPSPSPSLAAQAFHKAASLSCRKSSSTSFGQTTSKSMSSPALFLKTLELGHAHPTALAASATAAAGPRTSAKPGARVMRGICLRQAAVKIPGGASSSQQALAHWITGFALSSCVGSAL